MDERIAITGVGLISSLGAGKGAFWDSLWSAKSGIKDIPYFDAPENKRGSGGVITGFDAGSILGSKGIRTFDRFTGFVVAASKLALDDSRISPRNEDGYDAGMVLGTMLGSFRSLSAFDKVLCLEGPRYVSPADFPRTLGNLTASEFLIRYGISSFSTSVSTGFTSGLDAVGYAMQLLNAGKARYAIAGGAEELCAQVYESFYKSGFLSGSGAGGGQLCAPFDRRRNGAVLGEGACMLVLEPLKYAEQRGAKVYAELSGYESLLDTGEAYGYPLSGQTARRLMREAIGRSGLRPEDIDYVSAAANSTPGCDLMETRALKRVFGSRARKIPVSSIKSMLGECLGASGAFQIASCVGAFLCRRIPPTINLAEPDPDCDLDYVPNRARSVSVTNALINSFGPDGRYSSIIISRH